MFNCLVCYRQPERQTEHRHCNVGHFPDKSTDDCRVEFRYEKKNERSYYCLFHQQWVSEFAVETHYSFAHEQSDGTRESVGETDNMRKERYKREKKDPYSPAVRKVMNSGD